MNTLRKIGVASVVGLCLMMSAVAAFAQSGRETVPGVRNFGRVTDKYFRGGAVSPEGIENLNKMGVRTIIDLRDEPSPDEAPTAQRLGMKYYNFPMTGHDVPTEKEIGEILSLINNSKAPIYVHCSAGKHRAGTVAAVYRIRQQGWTKERAWAEQQSYGFGSPSGHPELYSFLYGQGQNDVAAVKAVSEKSSKKSKSKDDDDEKEVSKSSKAKKEEKLAKAKKDDDDDEADDDDDDDDKAKKNKKSSKKDKSSSAVAQVETKAVDAPGAAVTGLSAKTRYVAMNEAIERARAAGGKGEVLKVDLEWDELRNLPTWDVTFTSGSEYEVHALNGEVLGNKAKEPAKLATMIPLSLNSRKHMTFAELLRKVADEQRQTVMEVELKHLKGQGESIFEIALANGVTLFYDATTGETVSGAGE